MITHTIASYWIPSQKMTKSKLQILKIRQNFWIFEFWNGLYTRHTFWSCLIRCANMKWIRWVLLKIQSGHDSVHRRTDGRTDRRTDGQGDTSIPPYQLRWSGGYKNLVNSKYHNFIKDISQNISLNPKRFRSLMRAMPKNKSTPEKVYHENSCAKTPVCKAFFFNGLFESNFSDMPQHASNIPDINEFINEFIRIIYLAEFWRVCKRNFAVFKKFIQFVSITWKRAWELETGKCVTNLYERRQRKL